MASAARRSSFSTSPFMRSMAVRSFPSGACADSPRLSPAFCSSTSAQIWAVAMGWRSSCATKAPNWRRSSFERARFSLAVASSRVRSTTRSSSACAISCSFSSACRRCSTSSPSRRFVWLRRRARRSSLIASRSATASASAMRRPAASTISGSAVLITASRRGAGATPTVQTMSPGSGRRRLCAHSAPRSPTEPGAALR